jgi:hypothetical protein
LTGYAKELQNINIEEEGTQKNLKKEGKILFHNSSKGQVCIVMVMVMILPNIKD